MKLVEVKKKKEENNKMKLSTLLEMFSDDLFEIHFPNRECYEDYIDGEYITGEMCLKILRPEVLNSMIVKSKSHVEVYSSELARICVTIDFDLDKE